MQPRV